MSYKALYRKYRPETFESVTDQSHIVKTLKHAISTDRVSHAYIFSGPRGTGKTSIAKIFAKAVNCRHTNNGEPCGYCDVCKSYQDNSNPDIIEIDAASNNGVEYIRDLRESTKFLPTLSKYKVYIIDEVHMLTSSSFNAFLKILEEPPKHMIFILCTTDPDKIIPTIQSRCQRFDFHLISNEGIISRLKYVTKEEGIKISDEAIEVIAETAEGGMRDALSLLDQVIAYSQGDVIMVDDCLEVSGRISNELLTRIAKSLLDNNSTDAINLLSSLLKMGKEVDKIASNLLSFYKDILLIKNLNYSFQKAGYHKPEFIELVDKLNNQKIYKYMDILTSTLSDMKFNSNKRLYLELAFIKMGDKNEFKEVLLSDNDSLPKGYNPNVNYSNYVAPPQPRNNQNQPGIVQNVAPKVEVVNVLPKEETKPIIEANIIPKEEIKPQVDPMVTPKAEPIRPIIEPIIAPKEEKPVIEPILAPKEDIKPVVETSKEETLVNDQKEENNSNQQSLDIFDAKEEKIDAKEENQKEISDEDRTYDIHDFEEVFNHANRGLRVEICDKLNNLLNKYENHPRYSNYLGLIEDAIISACSNDAIIFVYQEASFSNLLMKDENYKAVQEMLKDFYGINFKLVTAPKYLFDQLQKDFVSQFKINRDNGTKEYIKLTYVPCPELKIIKKEEEKEVNEFQELEDLFGGLNGILEEK